MKTRTARKRHRPKVRPIAGVSVWFGGDALPPPTAADLIADLLAIDQDRAYFRDHPDRGTYRRPAVAGELRFSIPAGCVLEAVEVFQVGPRARAARPCFMRP
jgi:hypothetical protein